MQPWEIYRHLIEVKRGSYWESRNSGGFKLYLAWLKRVEGVGKIQADFGPYLCKILHKSIQEAQAL